MPPQKRRLTTNHVGTDVLIRPVERSSTRFSHAGKIAELRSAGQMRTSVPTWFVVENLRSAGELIAGQLQPVKIAQNCHCN